MRADVPDLASRATSVAGSPVREILALTARPEVISFAGGLPAPELFDADAVAGRFPTGTGRARPAPPCSTRPPRATRHCGPRRAARLTVARAAPPTPTTCWSPPVRSRR